jgi:hypothetical protein
MASSGLLVGVLLLCQVPPPALGDDVARELEAARRALTAREASELTKLAAALGGKGDKAGAEQVAAKLPRPAPADGASRFVPLPAVVAKSPPARTEPWRTSLAQIQTRAAAELYALAQRACRSASYALAGICLRGVIERQPDHAEARRLLGYVPHEGGWATPFAVGQGKSGLVDHPTFGWVPADWVPHLDRGELPAPLPRGQKKPTWLPAAEADRLRETGDPPWRISTEHFQIQTEVPLAEAIGFGRRLEAFHDVFMTLFADILGESLPLVRRFKQPKLTGEPTPNTHLVHYFASRSAYLDYLIPLKGQDISNTLGFFDPPPQGSHSRSQAFFFRDPGGQLPVTANLYHEVSHQLLFETAGPNAYTKNVGNYWVFEGLGTYFETVTPERDGSIEVGGFVGPRFEEAIRVLAGEGRVMPLAEFVKLDQNAFNREESIHFHYKQAMAFAVFLMQWHDATYRDDFLDYVKDAYRGRIKGHNGRSLPDHLGQDYPALDVQFRAFLTDAQAKMQGGERAAAKPAPEAQPATKQATRPRAIRTVVPAQQP